ncbi:hypothetical protein CABS01_01798 [Colletotrichum abscissum]|uniref:uncharacterized protein n=1 Tax=Colletotrichum abscissum TaxID=1671311 RepID=UPI0027D5864E|nr:uncharacterized protein CABS01_01798 [Colletotrichum abscissum]KAK1495991.1 hypothetical protein CABS01_01798 [Colletotrichum abscissum]
MRSWWRAKAFVLIKAVGTISCSRQAAEPSASSFPRNERNRATGTATDVDPVSACCGQFLEIDAIFTSSAPAGVPAQGPDHDRPARRIRSGVRACRRLQRHRPQRTQHRRRGELRSELESCRPRISHLRHPTLAWVQETATEVQGKRNVACASSNLFLSFASHDSAGSSTTRSTTPNLSHLQPSTQVSTSSRTSSGDILPLGTA